MAFFSAGTICQFTLVFTITIIIIIIIKTSSSGDRKNDYSSPFPFPNFQLSKKRCCYITTTTTTTGAGAGAERIQSVSQSEYQSTTDRHLRNLDTKTTELVSSLNPQIYTAQYPFIVSRWIKTLWWRKSAAERILNMQNNESSLLNGWQLLPLLLARTHRYVRVHQVQKVEGRVNYKINIGISFS